MRRRDLIKIGGMAIASTIVDQIVWPLRVRGAAKVTPRRTARNCIVLNLPGGISPPDTWDFKETQYTPKDLDVQKASSDLYLSKTLFPNCGVWAPRASFVRSMRANELVHFTGQYHTQTGRSLNVAVAKEIPAFGSVSDEEKKRWGNDFGISVMLARNVLAADAGTRFIYLADVGAGGNGPWDHHTSIFDHKSSGSCYVTCASLDRVLTNLVNDLSSMPGKSQGKTLLDETLVVVTSEFGRVPYINAGGGRDHYAECYTTMFLGGGVKPGRVIGKTDETCSKCIATGWNHKEQPWMDNTVATIYSALGIDWTKKIENTPSGRAYEYTQVAPIGGSEFLAHDEIAPLFE